MKKTKLLLLCTTCVPFLAGISACSGGNTDIGILQYGEFEALDNARKGFIDGLKEAGFGDLKIDYRNAHATDANVGNASSALASKKHKLNLAIATPCATALKSEQMAIGSTTPMLFTAVTDPVGSNLVTNPDAPEGFVTGSSDMQPDEAMRNQIGIVKKMMPAAEKLGIFYCANEPNSVAQATIAKQIAAEENLTVVEDTCMDALSIVTKISSMAPKVDAIWIPTDNTVASNMSFVKEGLGENKTLVVVGEEGMLDGGQVTVSISYYSLGLKTAELAVKILRGDAVSNVPVFYPTIDNCSYVYSEKNLTDAGFTANDLPTDYTWSKK